jgi:hypothetical protein
MSAEEALNAELCSTRPVPDQDALTVEDSDFIRAVSPFSLAVKGQMTPAEAFEAEWSDRPVPGRDAWIVGDSDFNQADLHSVVDPQDVLTVDPKDIAPEEVSVTALESQPAEPPQALEIEDLGHVTDSEDSDAGSDGVDKATDAIHLHGAAIICPFREADHKLECDRLMHMKDFYGHFRREHFDQFFAGGYWCCPLPEKNSPPDGGTHTCTKPIGITLTRNRRSGETQEVADDQLRRLLSHIFAYGKKHAYQPQGYRMRKREDGSSEKFGPRCRVFLNW